MSSHSVLLIQLFSTVPSLESSPNIKMRGHTLVLSAGPRCSSKSCTVSMCEQVPIPTVGVCACRPDINIQKEMLVESTFYPSRDSAAAVISWNESVNSAT